MTTKSAKPAKKSTGRKYGPAASQAVEREMKAFHEGKLKSGSGQKVTNPRQAIAIGLSEARESGAKMPPPPARAASTKKPDAAKPAARKTSARKTATKKAAAKKATARRPAGT